MRLLLVTVLALVSVSAATADTFIPFRTPSGNINCLYGQRSLRCDITSGLVPAPRGACDVDWTGLEVGVTGRAGPVCAGDTTIDRRARVVRYGSAWRRDGITCLSQRIGLRCTNRSGHGFFLSRQSWRLF
jgi:hypothetical protein